MKWYESEFAGCIGWGIAFFLIAVGVGSCVKLADGKTLTASWYSVESCKREGTWQKYGGKMANGRIFKDEELTCASWDYKFGSILRITNLKNKKTVIVQVTDRGPAKKLYRMGRVIDLSKSAFSKIADLKQGVIPIEVEVVNESK